MQSRDQGDLEKRGGVHWLLYNWLPVLLYCVLIFVQSSYPVPAALEQFLFSDKFYHFAGYALLGLLFLRGFMHSRFKEQSKLIIPLSIILTGLYGGLDELHQAFQPYRSADIYDLIVNLAGGLFGVYLYRILLERYPRLNRI